MNLRRATPQDAEGTAKVQVDSWNDTYIGIVPDEYLGSLFNTLPERVLRHRTKIEKADSIQLLAEDVTGNIVAWLAAGNARDKRLIDRGYGGEIYAVYLIKAVQGRGIGRALMVMAANELRSMGHSRAYVCALRDNVPAVRFYERLGAKFLFEEPLDVGGRLCPEVTMGFDNLEWAATGPSSIEV